MNDSEYGLYGVPRPLAALFCRSRPPGTAMPERPLAGDPAVGDAAAEIERESRQVDAIDRRRDAVDGRRRRVVAELQLVQHRRSKHALQSHDAVLRIGLDVRAAARDAFRLLVGALVAEVPRIIDQFV